MNVIEQYFEYLNTPKKQYNGVVEKPSRESTIASFQRLYDLNHNASFNAGLIVEKALNEGRKVYCWSDQHFGHDMLWKTGNRNFNSREEMNSLMASAFDNIEPDAVIIFGGDLVFYDSSIPLSLMKELPNEIIYVIGNHDVRGGNSLINKLKLVCKEVVVAFDFSLQINNDEKHCIVTHYPLIDSLENNQINLHGHTHKYLMGDDFFNMSVEHTEYKMMELHNLINSQK